jgi:hypothetical protein
MREGTKNNIKMFKKIRKVVYCCLKSVTDRAITDFINKKNDFLSSIFSYCYVKINDQNHLMNKFQVVYSQIHTFLIYFFFLGGQTEGRIDVKTYGVPFIDNRDQIDITSSNIIF